MQGREPFLKFHIFQTKKFTKKKLLNLKFWKKYWMCPFVWAMQCMCLAIFPAIFLGCIKKNHQKKSIQPKILKKNTRYVPLNGQHSICVWLFFLLFFCTVLTNIVNFYWVRCARAKANKPGDTLNALSFGHMCWARLIEILCQSNE